MANKYTIFYVLLFLTIATSDLWAQHELERRASPLEMVTMRYDSTYVKITYSRPQKRGRDLFGALVPYGEVWRTGANEATEITVSRDVIIHEDTLNAGTYSLFTIPGEEEWTIILNTEKGLWGAYNYKEDLDVMRFTTPVEQLEEFYEPFTIEIQDKGLKKVRIALKWDRNMVRFPLEVIPEPDH